MNPPGRCDRSRQIHTGRGTGSGAPVLGGQVRDQRGPHLPVEQLGPDRIGQRGRMREITLPKTTRHSAQPTGGVVGCPACRADQ
jgi:hypothetical protein